MTRARYLAASNNQEVILLAAQERELVGLTDQALQEELEKINSGYRSPSIILIGFAHKRMPRESRHIT